MSCEHQLLPAAEDGTVPVGPAAEQSVVAQPQWDTLVDKAIVPIEPWLEMDHCCTVPWMQSYWDTLSWEPYLLIHLKRQS